MGTHPIFESDFDCLTGAMLTVSRSEYYIASVVWYLHYGYILLVAIYELSFYKERFVKRNLMRPSYVEGYHRDTMDNEWELYRSIAPYLFLLMPVSYLAVDYMTRKVAYQRHLLVGFSLAVVGYLLSFNGLLILLLITAYFWFLGTLNSKLVIWVSAFGLTTVSNWYAHLFMQFVADDMGRYNRYFVEFIVVTQMFRIVSFALTVAEQVTKDSLYDAVEYNTYLPLLCGPWCIYPIYREDRLKRRPRWSLIELLKDVTRLASMFVFIECYLHFFPFSSVSADNHTRKGLSLTALAGVSLAAVQHFSNKYVVMYGFPAAFSTSIGIFCPPGPHNVSTRSTFRDMWQLFDKGLHLFLKNFIYVPLTTATGSAVLGSVVCFFCVFYWHGANETCAYWALVNWAGVSLERQLYIYSKSTQTRLQNRIVLSLQAVLFGLLIMSNLIYLFQWEVTLQIVKRLYTESLVFTVHAHVVLYCGVVAINTNHISKIKVN